MNYVQPDRLSTPVRSLMSPGVTSLPENASAAEAAAVMVDHRLHAVLILGRQHGTPIGWVTAQGLLPSLDRSDDLLPASAVITEEARTVEPTASARDALVALCAPDVTRLLVAHRGTATPLGVITALDLLRLAGT